MNSEPVNITIATAEIAGRQTGCGRKRSSGTITIPPARGGRTRQRRAVLLTPLTLVAFATPSAWMRHSRYCIGTAMGLRYAAVLLLTLPSCAAVIRTGIYLGPAKPVSISASARAGDPSVGREMLQVSHKRHRDPSLRTRFVVPARHIHALIASNKHLAGTVPEPRWSQGATMSNYGALQNCAPMSSVARNQTKEPNHVRRENQGIPG